MAKQNTKKFTKYSSPLIALGAVTMLGCGAPVAERVTAPAAAKDLDTFPQYRATNLNGKMVTVPSDGTSSHALVLVAFKRKQQRLIDNWLREAKPLMADNTTLDFLELPVIREMNPISRWFIARGMRGGIPSKHTRARVVTLHTDKAAFRKALSIPDEDSIYVYLVRRSDRAILWRARGDVSDARIAALSGKLGLVRQARR